MRQNDKSCFVLCPVLNDFNFSLPFPENNVSDSILSPDLLVALAPDWNLCGVDVDRAVIDALLGSINARNLSVEGSLVLSAYVAVSIAWNNSREIKISNFSSNSFI